MMRMQSAGSRNGPRCSPPFAPLPWLSSHSRLSLSASSPTTFSAETACCAIPKFPSLGNPKGDLTIVEYFDYQCPYCKKTAPELAQLAREDGNIRLVLKDWPIFGDVSVARRQAGSGVQISEQIREAHAILIGATSKLTETTFTICLRRPVSMLRWRRPTSKRIKSRSKICWRAIAPKPRRSDLRARRASSSALSGYPARWR